MTKWRSVVIAAVLASACAETVHPNGGIAVYSRYWEDVERELGYRAAIDLANKLSELKLGHAQRHAQIEDPLTPSAVGIADFFRARFAFSHAH
jgi:hypothetical protein